MNDKSKEWLQQLEQALLKSQQLPALQEGFPFPWDQAAAAISMALGFTEVRLSSRPSQWKIGEEIFEGMGNEPIIVSLELAPIGGSVVWMMSSEDVAALTAAALSSEQKVEGFSDPRLQEGFYQFLLLKSMGALDSIKALKDLSLRLLPQSEAPQEGGIILDVAIGLPTKTVYGRLVCPQSFLNEFKNYSPVQKESPLKMEGIKNLEVSLRTEVGTAAISASDWRSIMPGDFIILEGASYDPKEQKGSLILSLGDTPLLLCRFKPEGLKVADYAFYSKEPLITDDLGDIPELQDLPSSEDSPTENEKEDDPLWSSEEIPTSASEKKTSMLLTCELEKIRITVDKLTELKPDTFLDLTFSPEQGVDVSIQGKSVARGDLLKLGDSLGVRILSLHG